MKQDLKASPTHEVEHLFNKNQIKTVVLILLVLQSVGFWYRYFKTVAILANAALWMGRIACMLRQWKCSGANPEDNITFRYYTYALSFVDALAKINK